jgi:hypothetical protein
MPPPLREMRAMSRPTGNGCGRGKTVLRSPGAQVPATAVGAWSSQPVSVRLRSVGAEGTLWLTDVKRGGSNMMNSGSVWLENTTFVYGSSHFITSWKRPRYRRVRGRDEKPLGFVCVFIINKFGDD